VFEQNNRILLDGEDDDYINDTNLNPASMIETNILLDNEALIDNEIEQKIDDPENRMDEDLRVVENNYIVDQILNELDNNNDDFIEYDDIPIDNQNLLDDIFGTDSDNEESENPDSQEGNIQEPNAENNFDEAPILRRSARNYEPGKWSKTLAGTYLPRYSQTQNIHTRTYGFNMTVTEGTNKLGDKAVDSITLEMNQMLDRKVWKGVNNDLLNPEQRRSIIPCKIFLKEKTLADGSFDKLKSRIVAGGHMQDRDIYDNGSSPTVSTTSVFIIAALAAKDGRSLATIDFPGAFLNSDMPLEGDMLCI
jgi:Reverse transcriptase (RNA-dependent DNA polymerase)